MTAVVLLAGCGSLATHSRYTPSVTVAASTAPAPRPTPVPKPAPTAQRSRTATPGSTPAITSAPDPTSPALDAGRPSDQCPDDALGVDVIPGAGDGRHEVLITNTGGEPCALRGAPVVAVEGVDGSRLGPPADRARDGAATRMLGVGGSVAAPLRVERISSAGDPLDALHLAARSGLPRHPAPLGAPVPLRGLDGAGVRRRPLLHDRGARRGATVVKEGDRPPVP